MKLIEAADNNDLELVKKLIKEGYPLNNKTKTGLTALIYASDRNYKEIVKELIKAGASVTYKNKFDLTALDYGKNMWYSFEMQDLILNMYPHLYSFLEQEVGINKDILLKLKMKQILSL